MKIAIVTTSYPRSPRDGSGKFVPPVATELVRRGHRVTVLAPHRGPAEPVDDGVDVRWFPWLGGSRAAVDLRLGRPHGLVLAVSLVVNMRRALIDLLRVDRPDVCLAYWAAPAGIVAWTVRRHHGIPYAVWSLGSDVNVLARHRLTRQVVRVALRGAGARFANSFALRERVVELAGQPCAFLPIASAPVEPAVVSLDQTVVNLLYIGRLEPVKGVDLLLSALALLRAEGLEPRLHIVGQGSLGPALRQQVLASGLTHQVRLLGTLSNEDVAGYLRAADALVIPSRSESLPVVAIEAIRSSRPIVAAAVGDVPRLVSQYGAGLIVPPEDSTALAGALRCICERGAPPPGPNLAALQARFELTEIASQLETALADLAR
ncbi:MAG: glycosyltransferase [Chloroflexi bacterium]|nr:glycosyltransferase [Chloroflexota bacterium]